MTVIRAVDLRIILDSRGRKTVEADITTDKGFGRSAAPGGASCGLYEAKVKDPLLAIEDGSRQVIPHLIGIDSRDQIGFDALLREIDGTEQFSAIGANVASALSIANAKAASSALRIPLWRHLGGSFVNSIPLPLGNVIGGGAHAENSTEIQEFLVVPTGCPGIGEGIFANARVHEVCRELLSTHGVVCGKGDEGAWAPHISDQEAFDLLSEAIEIVSGEVGFQLGIGIDFAATQLYNPESELYEYRDGIARSSDEQIMYVTELIDEYNLLYVEDPLHEEDFTSFATLTMQKGSSCLICGDDLFVTHPSRIGRGIHEGSANCVLIKPNQVGTLTDTYEAISLAQRHGMETVISHRSGETEDAAIAHIGCAFGCAFIKTGIVGGERTVKLNELIRIEENMYERK